MSTFSERLALAMTCQGLNPHSDQSELARRVGHGCKPQNVQHLLDPNKNARSSKYTPLIAEALNCDANWLAFGAPYPAPDCNRDKQGSAGWAGGETPRQTEADLQKPYLDLAHQAAHDLILRDVLDKFIEGGEKAVTIAWTALLLAEDNEKTGRSKPGSGHKKAAAGGKK